MTRTRPYDLLIFDLDGVITTEFIYWECARLTLWELLHGPDADTAVDDQSPPFSAEAREMLLPVETIYAIKNRAINSNWDLTYLVSCALLLQLPASGDANFENVNQLGDAIHKSCHDVSDLSPLVWALLAETEGLSGADLLEAVSKRVWVHLNISTDLVSLSGSWWQFLFDRFQLWYNGTLLSALGAPLLQEKATLPVHVVWETLEALRNAGYTLGIATGRPYQEAKRALQPIGLWEYFDEAHIATYDVVEQAETESGQSGLGKPHPLTMDRALYPHVPVAELLRQPANRTVPSALVIGDTTSDVVAAKAAGLPCVGVLSGVHGKDAETQRQQALLAAGAVDVMRNIALLPHWLGERDHR